MRQSRDLSALPSAPGLAHRSAIVRPRAELGSSNETLWVALSLAMCLAYLLRPSLPIVGAVFSIGVIVVLVRPELAVIFLGFGWIAQRQMPTYWSGIPLLLLGLLGGAIRLPLGLRNLRRDKRFLFFFAVSAFFSGVSLIVRPAWQGETINRIIYMAAGFTTYVLCTRDQGRRYAEVAAICCGVAVAVNAIVRAQALGMTTMYSGDVIALRLNDSNYASIPVVFGAALVLERLSGGRILRKSLPLFVASLGIMAWGLMMLASRGGQLAFLVVCGLWLLRLIFSRLKSGKMARLSLALVTVILVIVAGKAVISDELLLANRLRWEDALPSGGSNRMTIYQDALQILTSQPSVVFGGGIGYNFDLLSGVSAHNQILDSLFDYGIVGVIGLLWLWAGFLMDGVGRRSEKDVMTHSILLPAAGLGVTMLTLSPIWFSFFWVEVAYLAACCVARTQSSEESDSHSIGRLKT